VCCGPSSGGEQRGFLLHSDLLAAACTLIGGGNDLVIGKKNSGGAGGDGGTGTSGGAGGDGGTETALSYCLQGCTEDADCCGAADPNCPGDYPSNPTCTADGWCMFPQCSTNDDCTMGGAQPGWECFEVNLDLLGTAHMCGPACADDSKCTCAEHVLRRCGER